jgi:hypothetical protein
LEQAIESAADKVKSLVASTLSRGKENGGNYVEREVATQALVKLGNHHTMLTAEQERIAVAAIHGMLEARGRIRLAAIPLLLWGALRFLRTLIRTTNRVGHVQT